MTLRVGIIGYGKWSPNLCRNIKKHAAVTWVCERDDRAFNRALDDGYLVVEEPHWDSVDAIVIATPISTHFELAEKALANGKHVLCEKPMATDSRDVRLLATWARASGLTLMMSCPWLYHPAIQRAGEVARDLGAPIWFRAARTSWDERDLNPIADLLPHDVGILKAWTGQRVAEVSAVREGPAASVTLRTDGGVLGTIQYTYRDAGKHRRVEMGCGGGSVRCDELYLIDWAPYYGLEILRGGRRLPDDYKRDALGPEPLDAMCAEFVDCCKAGRTPRYGNVDDALHVAEAIEAAHKSVSERRVVTL